MHKYLIFLIITMSGLSGICQIPITLTPAMESGNARELGRLMAPIITLSLQNEDYVISRQKAETILQDFFQNNPVSSFKLIQDGSASTGVQYVIGELTSKESAFGVSMYFEEILSHKVINQININAQ